MKNKKSTKLLTSQNAIFIITASLILYFSGCSSPEYYESSLELEPPRKFKRELDLLRSDSTTSKYQRETYSTQTDVNTSTSTKYIVKKGDTMWKIAYDHGVSPDVLIKQNHIRDVTDIKPGQRLIIPAGFTGTKRTFSRTSLTSSRKSDELFIWPLKGKTLSRFNQRINKERNTGIDIQAYNGQSVKASKGGIVALVSNRPDGWGNVVILQHDDGSYTWYAYNSEVLVRKGDVVSQGRTIAKAGSTGRAKKDKLHFKIFMHGMPVNPLYYLR